MTNSGKYDYVQQTIDNNITMLLYGLTYMQCIHIENHYSPLTAGDKTKTQSISRGLTKKSTSYNIYFYEETIFLAFSSIFSLLNDVNSSERNRNIF